MSSKDGEIIPYSKINRTNTGKKLDQRYSGKYVDIYTTNKAHTAMLDGGGRTSEYERDLGSTLQKRNERFLKKSFEISDGKVILLAGLIDSRFFSGPAGPNAIKLIQSMVNNKDTFLTNACTLAKFMKLIDVPEVLTDTHNVIENTFNQLSVEI